MGIDKPSVQLHKNVYYIQYGLERGNTPGLHDWLVDFDSKFIRGEACANHAHKLRQQGFYPDLICAHPGWGEALFLKDIWPNSKLLCYQEFYYNAHGYDYDFDIELQGKRNWSDDAKLRLKNINPLLMLEAADWNITPTRFQRSTFPKELQAKITSIHDGIDISRACANKNIKELDFGNGIIIKKTDEVITFVNRRIEPYRGCHSFIRSIPYIQSENPNAYIVIVGGLTGVSYGNLPKSGSWREIFLKEIEGSYDPSKVLFTGRLDYSQYLKVLQISSCHVYLTYPFVLSWSLLEAMSIGCPVVGSKTEPVEEVITNRENGLLVDFFSTKEIANSVTSILKNSDMARQMGQKASDKVKKEYSLQTCIPQQISLINLVASGKLYS